MSEQDKIKYVGEWKNDQISGYGTYYFQDANKFIGNWQENCALGLGAFINTKNEIWTGYFQNNLLNGLGIEKTYFVFFIHSFIIKAKKIIIRVNSKMVKNKDWDSVNGNIKQLTMDIGSMILWKVLEFSNGQMGKIIMGIGKITV